MTGTVKLLDKPVNTPYWTDHTAISCNFTPP